MHAKPKNFYTKPRNFVKPIKPSFPDIAITTMPAGIKKHKGKGKSKEVKKEVKKMIPKCKTCEQPLSKQAQVIIDAAREKRLKAAAERRAKKKLQKNQDEEKEVLELIEDSEAAILPSSVEVSPSS